MVDIGLSHDGADFLDKTAEEFVATLLMLKESGYQFPDYVIDAAKKEIDAD